MEVGGAADADQLAATLELGRHRDGVGGLAAAVEVDDRVVDDLVGRAVEVDAADQVGDVGDGVLGQQHRAEHALLGGVVLRRGAVAGTGGTLAGLVARGSVAPVLGGRLREARPVGTPLVGAPAVVLGDAHAGASRGGTRGGAGETWGATDVTGVTIGRTADTAADSAGAGEPTPSAALRSMRRDRVIHRLGGDLGTTVAAPWRTRRVTVQTPGDALCTGTASGGSTGR